MYRKAIYLLPLLLPAIMPLIASNSLPKSKPIFQWNQYAALPGTGNQPSLGYAGPVAGIFNNVLFIGGGANFPEGMPWMGGPKKYYSEAHITDVTAKAPVFKKCRLPYKVAYGANCSTTSGIVCAGGEDEQGPLRSVLLIRPDKETAAVTLLPALPLAISNAAATVIGSVLYIAGGETKTTASARFLKLDLRDTAKGWQYLPDIPHAVSHSVLLALPREGKLFLAGGRSKTASGISNLYNNLFEFDIASGRWIEKKSLPYALSAGTGALIHNRYIALFGGDRGTVFHKTELLISAISKEPDRNKKQALIEEKKQLQMTHPGFSNEVLLYDIKKDLWTSGGIIPFKVPATTTAVKKDNRLWIPSGEIKAGVRTPVILEATIQ